MTSTIVGKVDRHTTVPVKEKEVAHYGGWGFYIPTRLQKSRGSVGIYAMVQHSGSTEKYCSGRRDPKPTVLL